MWINKTVGSVNYVSEMIRVVHWRTRTPTAARRRDAGTKYPVEAEERENRASRGHGIDGTGRRLYFSLTLLITKTTTLIVNVDLDCPRCYRQIRKVLCKLQATADQERIRSISYDGNNHTISISGPFDPLQLCGKIRCMGGKVVRDIQIKQPPPPPPPPPPPCTCNRDIEELKQDLAELQRQLRVCVEQNRDMEQLKVDVEELQKQLRICVHQNQDIEQLKLDVAELKEQAQKCAARRPCHGSRPCQQADDTTPVDIPSSGYSHPWCYSGRYEGCRCGGGYAGVRPTLAGCHGGACGCYRGCQFVGEEDASTGCSVM